MLYYKVVPEHVYTSQREPPSSCTHEPPLASAYQGLGNLHVAINAAMGHRDDHRRARAGRGALGIVVLHYVPIASVNFKILVGPLGAPPHPPLKRPSPLFTCVFNALVATRARYRARADNCVIIFCFVLLILRVKIKRAL